MYCMMTTPNNKIRTSPRLECRHHQLSHNNTSLLFLCSFHTFQLFTRTKTRIQDIRFGPTLQLILDHFVAFSYYFRLNKDIWTNLCLYLTRISLLKKIASREGKSVDTFEIGLNAKLHSNTLSFLRFIQARSFFRS
jgi:hypothetical protein